MEGVVVLSVIILNVVMLSLTEFTFLGAGKMQKTISFRAKRVFGDKSTSAFLIYLWLQ
jgi:hypothetical protein